MHILKLFLFLVIIITIFCIQYIFDIENTDNRQSDPKIAELKEKLNPMSDLKYYISQVEIFRGKKSFIINKKEIFLCLYDENGNYYSDNMLLYVLLHEIAHSIAHSDGHTIEFNEIFENLLTEAKEKNIIPNDFQPNKNYCNF
jgi:Zn-dependent peptidase ImmA (M78 family)